MVKRLRCMSMLCVGSFIVSTAQANKMENVTGISVPVASTQLSNLGLPSVIDQDLMNMVAQVMYGKTAGQVIDELVYTYGHGALNTVSLAAVAQLLSQQLGYLTLAIESAQAIVAVLPPTSPHLVAAKLIINELSMLVTCVQTVLTQVQQSSQAPAAVSATGAASTATPTTSTAPASSSSTALANAAVSLLGDIASALASSHTTSSSNAPATTSSTTASAATSNTHHHGSHTSW
jgi:hypothetical protein